MKFFLPFWGDRIDMNYDFVKGSSRGGREDRFIWEVFDPPPLDGVLVSRPTLDKLRVLNEVLRVGIKKVLRWNGPVLGDCGAWEYVLEDEPPYEPHELLRYYYDAGFDIGVAPDHIITRRIMKRGRVRELSKEEMRRRWEITIRNAEFFFREWYEVDKYYMGLRIMGVVQGWDTSSYGRTSNFSFFLGSDNL